MSDNNQDIPRVTGLLVIEVRNSNPNGDPDRESDPRTRGHDGRGIISDVSFKRKLRELVLLKEGPVWKEMKKQLGLEDGRFGIHVDQDTRDKEKAAKVAGQKKSLSESHWDVRLFGSTSLEEGDNFIRTGVAQFSIAVSAAKVRIQRDTNTVKANVDADKKTDRGMAPLGFRVVEHGVYAMPFLINPTAATKSGCTREDIELMCKLVPYAYSHNPSRIRTLVEVRHAWYFEHESVLGSCSDFAVLDALTPSKAEPNEPSTSWGGYGYEGAAVANAVREMFANKFRHFGDLCDPAFVNQVFPRGNG
ncbi:MAG: type I CRISPR-associated protein Cas7 [Betaproteobacteria bacterium]|nr:type I CRISPR-associated protein Cas7 [Betaproteobacteria bacterium]